MSNIKEIAKKANVSIATVSNILNGKGGVSRETAKRVLEIADELHYTPNFLAKNLKRGNTRTIGILTEDLTVFNATEIVDGINAYCEENSYHFILANLRLFKKYAGNFYELEGYVKQVEDEIRILLAKQVEGIIYIGCHSREISAIPSNLPVPLVVAYGYVNNDRIPSVVFDDEKAAFDATCHLIGKGHKKIGLAAGIASSVHTRQRVTGYQRALYENGILFNPDLLVYGDWNRDFGYREAGTFINQGATAIFAMNDLIAGGVIDYCNENGLKVGRDISLIGFDNREISSAYNPQLTTMALPLFEIGKKSSEIMLEMLDTEHPRQFMRLYKIECQLVERQSVGLNG